MGIGIRIENLRKVYDTPPPSAARGVGFPSGRNGRRDRRRRKRSSKWSRLRMCRSKSGRAKSSACWGRTARANPPRSASSPRARAHRRPRLRRRVRRVEAAGGGQAADRRGAPAAQSGFRPDGARDPAISRGLFRPEQARLHPAHGRVAGEVQADRPRRPHGAGLFGRHDAAALHRPGHDARSRSAVPGRAFGGPGSADASAVVGDHPRLQPRR